MTSKVIIKKQKASDDKGHLAIQYFNGNGKKKIKSLGIPISEVVFNDCFSKIFQRFEPCKLLEYKTINKAIDLAINDFSIFDVKTAKTNSDDDLLSYFKKRALLKENRNTKNVRNSVYNKIVKFQALKNLDSIPFHIIDANFIEEFKIEVRKVNVGKTTKTYMNVLKTVLNSAKRDGLYFEKYDYFKGLDYQIIEKTNSALTLQQVQMLIDGNKEEPNPTINMFLAQLFMNGLRVSDLLLLRNQNFKAENIEYIMKKTNYKMDCDYDDKIVSIFTAIYGLKSLYEHNKLSMDIDKVLDIEYSINNKNIVYGGTSTLIEYVQSLPPNNFVFEKFMAKETSLINYNHEFEMTDEQQKAFTRLIVKYRSDLKKVAIKYKITKIVPHTARYTFCNLVLSGENPDILSISKLLGHKNLATIQAYLNKNFGKENQRKVVKTFNNSIDL